MEKTDGDSLVARQSRIAPEPKELERPADAEETRRVIFFAKKNEVGGVVFM